MSDSFRYAQLQTFFLSGGGASIGDTSFTLQSMLDIDGNALSMSGTFGAIGFGTLEAGNGNLEEQISFTGLTNNTNGTVTLSGVSNVSFTYPYTQTSGLAKTHAGSATFIISNTSGFYDELTSKADDETITGKWTFPSDDVNNAGIASDVDTTIATAFVTLGQLSRQAISGASNASTTVKGIVQLPTQAQVDAKTTTGSTGALLALTPDKQRSTLLSDYVIDTGAADAYAIAPTPAITAYATGQIFTFKAANTNTTTSTLAVSGLASPKTIKKNGTLDLVAGDIVSGGIYVVENDGTNFQLLSQIGNQPASLVITQNSSTQYAVDAGSANTYTAPVSPAIAAYTSGLTVRVKISNTSTGASTLNPSGLGAKTIKKLNGAVDITKGDLVSGSTYEFTYDGTNFVTEVDRQYSNGVLAVASNSGANVITTGFKPRVLRFNWCYASGGTSTVLPLGGTGTWVNGAYAETFVSNSATSGGAAVAAASSDTTAVVSGASTTSTGTFTGAVGSLSDTGFTLTMANATGATPTVQISWEAES